MENETCEGRLVWAGGWVHRDVVGDDGVAQRVTVIAALIWLHQRTHALGCCCRTHDVMLPAPPSAQTNTNESGAMYA